MLHLIVKMWAADVSVFSNNFYRWSKSGFTDCDRVHKSINLLHYPENRVEF